MQLLTFIFVLALWVVQISADTCPGEFNQCSLHGTCMLSKSGTRICNCEWGYTDDDCSRRLCPHGVDPMVMPKKEPKKLRLTISSESEFKGKVLLTYHRHVVEMNVIPLKGSECAFSFGRFRNFLEPTCELVEDNGKNGGVYEITLAKFPVDPVMNNLFAHRGDPMAKDFTCDTTRLRTRSPVTCKMSDVNLNNIQEYVPCSNQGACDNHAGKCTCEPGFYGENCASNKDHEDVLKGESHGQYFTGNLAKLYSARDLSNEFNFISATTKHGRVFDLQGDGNATLHQGSLFIKNGQHRIENGGLFVTGGVDVEESNVQIRGGALVVEKNLVDHKGIHVKVNAADQTEPAFQIDTFDSAKPYTALGISLNNKPLFEIENTGKLTSHHGGVSVLGETGLQVGSGGIHTMQSGIRIGGVSRDVIRGLSVEDGGISVKTKGISVEEGGLIIKEGGALMRSSAKTQPTLIVESTNADHEEGILRIVGKSGKKSSLIQGYSGSELLVDIDNKGQTTLFRGGLKVLAGKLEIQSGGQLIEAGGLHIKSGGLQIDHGKLHIEDGFSVNDGGFSVQNSASTSPGLHVLSNSKLFAGSSLVVETESSTSTALLMEAKNAGKTVFAVRSDGQIETTGDIITKSPGRIVSGGDLIAQKKTILTPMRIVASDKINISPQTSYVQIIDDGKDEANALYVEKEGAITGQLLFIQNSDAQDTSGLSISSESTSIFLFDGNVWQCISSGGGVTKKEIHHHVNDIVENGDRNFGEIKLMARDLQAGSQTASHVTFYGKGGKLVGNDGFKFVNDELQVPMLRAGEIVGRVNMSSSELANVHILGGNLQDVNIHASSIFNSGELHVASNTFIGNDLLVHGQVMGSGSYVDTSDFRFKRDIHNLNNSLSSIRRMQGVRYYFRSDEFPNRNFATTEQFGFIADDIEKIEPSLITLDKEGYRHLSYSRIIPIVVEAVKEQDVQQEELKSHISNVDSLIENLQNEVHALRIELARERDMRQSMAYMLCRMQPMSDQVNLPFCDTSSTSIKE